MRYAAVSAVSTNILALGNSGVIVMLNPAVSVGTMKNSIPVISTLIV